MSELEKALAYAQQEISKKFGGKAVSEDDIYDEIYDCMEQYGEDNDLPEGWWMEYGEIDDIFVMLQERIEDNK